MTENNISAEAKAEAIRQISGPSVGLLVTGIVGGVFSLIGMVALIIGAGITSVAGLESDWIDKIPWGIEEIYEGAFSLGFTLIELLVAGFLIYVAFKIKELKQWGLGVAACILAMLPCVSPCCIIGLPIGIWCLIVLMKPEVRDSFT